jgi:hypothetical protein
MNCMGQKLKKSRGQTKYIMFSNVLEDMSVQRVGPLSLWLYFKRALDGIIHTNTCYHVLPIMTREYCWITIGIQEQPLLPLPHLLNNHLSHLVVNPLPRALRMAIKSLIKERETCMIGL